MATQLSLGCNIFCSATASESADDLHHIEELVDGIDCHIRQLTELKNTLHRRANQLRSPLYALPFDVLSHIFHHIIDDSDRYRDWDSPQTVRDWTPKRIGLRQILSLTSISSYLREVAMRTPGLWKPMFLQLGTAKVLRCILYAEISSIFCDPPPLATIGEADRMTAALSSDIMHHVRFLCLEFSCRRGPQVWEPSVAAFPVLTTLDIRIQSEFSNLQLQTIPLSQLSLYAPYLSHISVPTSLQVLTLCRVPDEIATSILYQCPNLTECIHRNYGHPTLITSFSRPLTLAHLRRFIWPVELGLMDVASVENLTLPALTYLKVKAGAKATVEGIVKLCIRVSGTLTALRFIRASRTEWYSFDDTQLLRTSMPRLRSMLLSPHDVSPAIRAVIESNYSMYLPSLRTLRLYGLRDYMEPNFSPSEFIRALKEQKSSGPAQLRVDINLVEEEWTEELKEELTLLTRDGRIKIKCSENDIVWLESGN